MENLLVGYLTILIAEVSILPTGKVIQKINKELSRKWCHLLAGSILWFGSLLFDNLLHQVIITFLYLTIGSLCQMLDLIADQREDEKLNNEKAVMLYGIGQVLMALPLLIDSKYLLHYGIATFTLAFGDAFAALVGVNFGKYSIKLPHNKSLIGSIAFIIAAMIGMMIPCTILGYGITLLPELLLLAIIGCVVEIYSGDWDNLLIQVIVGFIALLII